MTAPRRLLQSRVATPLFDSATTRRIEQRASAPLPAHELMRRAGLASMRLARAIAPHARRVWIAAGPGNNGGDGLVLATLLRAAGVEVCVSLVGHDATRVLPVDAAWALVQAREAGVAVDGTLPADTRLWEMDLYVDALLGVGQTRAPEGALVAAIAALNQGSAPVLSIDVPTGLDADTGRQLGAVGVRATYTLTLLTAKTGLFTGAGREAAGEIWFDGLGVGPDGNDLPQATLSSQAEAAAQFPARRHLANKGSFGDVHVAGGAAGMVGASLLAGHSASMAGAGRVLVHAHSSDAQGVLPVDVRHPELMLRPVADLQPALRQNARATVVAGCGGGDEAALELPGCLSTACRLVLDADALNAIARDDGLREQLRERARRGQPTILTPHPLEAARLLGLSAGDVQADRPGCARRLAADTGAIVVLKGSGTLVAAPGGRVSVNPSGDARLATAGTGDVLAGCIGGLWATRPHPDQHAALPALREGSDAVVDARVQEVAHAVVHEVFDSAFDAAFHAAAKTAFNVAVAAVFVHGRACDFAGGDRLPLLASDLVDAITRATQSLRD